LSAWFILFDLIFISSISNLFQFHSYTMSAVQPVAVYALRVPPGAMVAAVPNAAASVSFTDNKLNTVP
jgi:hypothetical protein